ncbi:MAG: DUF2970 domain-containing protein [Gammaproteobacteria bacterium]|nr:DUF2970 domain-containing protein [Gammaproteobacteria bacterium]
MADHKPSIFQVIGSVVAAAFGVQTAANRERDFQGGSAIPYLVAGVIFTLLFILGIVGVVKLVLGS